MPKEKKKLRKYAVYLNLIYFDYFLLIKENFFFVHGTLVVKIFIFKERIRLKGQKSSKNILKKTVLKRCEFFIQTANPSYLKQ